MPIIRARARVGRINNYAQSEHATYKLYLQRFSDLSMT